MKKFITVGAMAASLALGSVAGTALAQTTSPAVSPSPMVSPVPDTTDDGANTGGGDTTTTPEGAPQTGKGGMSGK